jgi:hypothetical protein
MPQPLAIAVACLVAGGSLLILLPSAVFIVVYRKSPVVIASSGAFNFLVLAGALCVYAVTALQVSGSSVALCVLNPMLGLLGFCLAFGAIFSKAWRLGRIFGKKELSGGESRGDEETGDHLPHLMIDHRVMIASGGFAPTM